MGYGFKAIGSNNQTLFNTDDANRGGYFLDIVSGPTAFTNNTSVSYSLGDIILAKATVSSGQFRNLLHEDTGSSITFVSSNTTGHYIKARPANTTGSNPSGYGLSIYDGTGTAKTDLLFTTSDTNTKALDIQTIYDMGALSGDADGSTGSELSTSLSGLYVSLKGGTENGIGDRKNQFVFYNNYTDPNSNVNWGSGFSFVSQWLDLVPIGIGNIYFPNITSIIVASIRS